MPGRRRNAHSPTIFSDEIEFTLDLPLASPNRARRPGTASRTASRRSYTLLVAPAWWIDDTHDRLGGREADRRARDDVRDLFPAYGLARLVVSRPWALFAAAGTVADAAARLCAVPDGRAAGLPDRDSRALPDRARDRARRRAGRSRSPQASARSPHSSEGELSVLWPVLFLSAFALAWRTNRFSAWRSTWSGWDWAGAGHARRSESAVIAQRCDRPPLGGVVLLRRASTSSGRSSMDSGRSAPSRSASASSRWSPASRGSAPPPSDPSGISAPLA